VSFATASQDNVPSALLAGCDRFVHPDVEGPDERRRQGRLIAALLAAPFAAGIIVALAPVLHLGPERLLIVPATVAALAWAIALALAKTGRGRAAEWAALAAASALVVVAIAWSGPFSPLVLLPAAVGFETYWIGRTRHAALAGIAVGIAGTMAGLAAGAMVEVSHLVATPAQWLLPILYLSLSWPRLRALAEADEGDARNIGSSSLVERFDLALVTVARGGEIRSLSRPAAEFLGLSAELLTGTAMLDRVHVADRVAFLSALSDAQCGTGTKDVELRLRVAVGEDRSPEYRPLVVDCMPGAEGGEAMLLLRDASRLAGLQDELQKARSEAESIELAKSRFLAAVSHELRTPLNSIIGFSEMLIHGVAGDFADQRQREYVEVIHESGSHLLSVVNAILDVSKIESGAYSIHPEPFVLSDAAQLCRSMTAKQAADKQVALTVDITAGLGEVCADRRAVQQIMLNLLTNAIKFTPAGGDVRLEARRRGRWLRIAVSDTGIGIAEEDLARLGQPFTQVRNDFTRQFDGAGLGLSLVRGLVRLHEGRMVIESAPGEGTTVEVLLPLDGPKGKPAHELAAEGRSALPGMTLGGKIEEIRKTA